MGVADIAIEVVELADASADVAELLYTSLYADYGVARSADWLHADDGGVFVLARDGEDGGLLGVARLLPPGADEDAN